MKQPGPTLMLCRLQDLPERGARGFDLNGEGRDSIFVVRVGASVHGYRNACPHVAGAPMPWRKDAYLNADASRIVCHGHGAQFDIATGECLVGPCLGEALTRVTLSVSDDGAVLLEAGDLTQT